MVSKQGSLWLESVNIPSLHPTVVPVVVHAPKPFRPFLFVGVWTHKPYAKVAWKSMLACDSEAKKRKLAMVAAGDFNITPTQKSKKAARDSSKFLECMSDKLKLVSAYHHLYDEMLGPEKHATHYFKGNKCNPFHLDYCFVPESWCKLLVGVIVLPFEAFQMSDHRPLTVRLLARH